MSRPALTHCKRCGIEFEENNPAHECSVCDRLTLCLACVEDHACCQPDAEPCPHCLHQDCQCSDADVNPDMGDQ